MAVSPDGSDMGGNDMGGTDMDGTRWTTSPTTPRGEHSKLRGLAQEFRRDCCAGSKNVLAVVQHDEIAAFGEPLLDGDGEVDAGSVAATDCRGKFAHHIGVVVDRSQLAQPHGVTGGFGFGFGGGSEGKACLARAAGADERDETRLPDESCHRCQLGGAPDEARELSWQVAALGFADALRQACPGLPYPLRRSTSARSDHEVLSEDRPLQVDELSTGGDAELLAEQFAQTLVGA
jgi:hypothetical protein